jgi:hypothetical protein
VRSHCPRCQGPRRARAGKYSLDRCLDAAERSRLNEVLEHHRAARICAMRLAMTLPAMSGAEPCTGSNIDGKRRVRIDVARWKKGERARDRRDQDPTACRQRGCSLPRRRNAQETSRTSPQDVDAVLITLHVRVFVCDLAEAFIPEGQGVDDPRSTWSLMSRAEGRAGAPDRTQTGIPSVLRRVNVATCTATSSSPCPNLPPTCEYSPSVFSLTIRRRGCAPMSGPSTRRGPDRREESRTGRTRAGWG